MTWDQIEVPKEIRPFMLGDAEETPLGQKNGAKRQYRYGNLHILEYNDKYLVHMDKADPRKDPLGHLILDAPEFLVGAASAFVGGRKMASEVYKLQKNLPFAKGTSLLVGFLASMATGYLGYSFVKKLKNF
ncbi:MAG: hypothetical protein AUH25_00615 [Thaumarchaeota archaeon 13_1_40CM_38_12]|nr:MAG: hypothetical protein AUH25_00615 [Thaumarchaeota archaeon 13_1_40CM_38_12]OLD30547.1 MAG: hypothetical protein AUI62_01175 [Thaumarchaeota archaeon 13_1_40CM_2_39_7]TLY03621.1 MAG: hypothetical protein E6K87_04625 [Nitrososphaerota archaeon]TLY09416.1 MAG: hypothetical protein E6K83_00115 [Nitrososphaerota archaeon]